MVPTILSINKRISIELSGHKGNLGKVGDKGDRGARGMAGPQGPKGSRGQKGKKDDIGKKGKQVFWYTLTKAPLVIIDQSIQIKLSKF